MYLKKKQLKALRDKFGTYLTFLFYLQSNGVEESHAEQLLDGFVSRFGFCFLESMNIKDFRDLLNGLIKGYKDGESIRQEHFIHN